MLQKLLEEKVHGSLDIGSKNIRALTLSKGRIDRIMKKSIAGVGRNEERIAEGLESALGEIVDELKLRGKNMVLSLSGQRFYSKSIVIPREEDEDKRRDMVYEELESIIPGYDPLDFITEEIQLRLDAEEEEILTISIERERIEEILKILTRMKVTVVKIIPDYIACYNIIEHKILADSEDRYGGVTGVIDMGFEGTKIFFIDKNGIKMFVNTLIGGGEFTEIIREYKNTTYEDAEEAKKEMELGEKQTDEGAEVEMFTELTNTFRELEENISVSLDYFTKKAITSNIHRLILVGEGALLKGFREYLQEKTSLETSYIDYDDLGLEEELEDKLGEYHRVEVASLIGNVAGEVI